MNPCHKESQESWCFIAHAHLKWIESPKARDVKSNKHAEHGTSRDRWWFTEVRKILTFSETRSLRSSSSPHTWDSGEWSFMVFGGRIKGCHLNCLPAVTRAQTCFWEYYCQNHWFHNTTVVQLFNSKPYSKVFFFFPFISFLLNLLDERMKDTLSLYVSAPVKCFSQHSIRSHDLPWLHLILECWFKSW